MKRADIGEGINLEYEVQGDGEPVLLIHGAFIAGIFGTLVAEPALSKGYRLITYARRGYAGSSHPSGVLTVNQHAADCRALLAHLQVDRAHVLGHSYGGCVALQLALDAPGVVHSLALLEPALMVGASGEQYRQSLEAAGRRYREVGAATAMDESMSARWPGYREPLERALPGAFDQGLADAATPFESELPGLSQWTFGEAEARRISQPALSVLGGESNALWPRFGETHRLLLEWLPDVEGFILPGATHFLQVEDPKRMAGALAEFWSRHPMRA